MASPSKPSAAPPIKRIPRFTVIALVVVAAAGALLYLHHAPDETTTTTPPVAAVQPEVTTPQALPHNHIYSETSDPKGDIAAALAQAKREHKRVLLDFGGDWCGDCQVLDLYFHQAPNSALLASDFVLVHVFIGRMDKNLDIPAKYDVPIKKGVPALAVLDSQGKVLYSQTTGEFENMRNMDPASVSEFLNRWKA